MKTFRRHCLKSALVLLGCTAAAAAQTAQDFQGRYGPPVSASHAARPGLDAGYGAPLSETYVVRPDISLTVTYAADGEACRVEIKPYSATPESFPAPDLVSAEEVSKIIDEVAPAEARGKSLNAFVSTTSCNELAFDTYERVEISRAVRAERCDGGGAYSATVVWKGRRCARTPAGGKGTRPGRAVGRRPSGS
jgi:hypothetical protein